MSNIDTETHGVWLSDDDLEQVRAQLPIVYVEAIPVRVDGLGHVTEIGLLLRQAADGTISRLGVIGDPGAQQVDCLGRLFGHWRPFSGERQAGQ